MPHYKNKQCKRRLLSALEFAYPFTVGDIFETRYHGNISELGPCAHNPAGLCLKCKAFKYFSERNPRYLFFLKKYNTCQEVKFLLVHLCVLQKVLHVFNQSRSPQSPAQLLHNVQDGVQFFLSLAFMGDIQPTLFIFLLKGK